MNYIKELCASLLFAASASAQLSINEVDLETDSGIDRKQYIEILNTSGAEQSLENWRLVLYATNNASYRIFELSGTLPADAVYTVGRSFIFDSNLFVPDQSMPVNSFDATGTFFVLYKPNNEGLPVAQDTGATPGVGNREFVVDAVYGANQSQDLTTLEQIWNGIVPDGFDAFMESIDNDAEKSIGSDGTLGERSPGTLASTGADLPLEITGPTEIAESSGTVTLELKSGQFSGNKNPNVESSDSSEIRPAGTSVFFFGGVASLVLEVADDSWVDGDKTVTVSVGGDGFETATLEITVTDDADDAPQSQWLITEVGSFGGEDGNEQGGRFAEFVNTSASTQTLESLLFFANNVAGPAQTIVSGEEVEIPPGGAFLVITSDAADSISGGVSWDENFNFLYGGAYVLRSMISSEAFDAISLRTEPVNSFEIAGLVVGGDTELVVPGTPGEDAAITATELDVLKVLAPAEIATFPVVAEMGLSLQQLATAECAGILEEVIGSSPELLSQMQEMFEPAQLQVLSGWQVENPEAEGAILDFGSTGLQKLLSIPMGVSDVDEIMASIEVARSRLVEDLVQVPAAVLAGLPTRLVVNSESGEQSVLNTLLDFESENFDSANLGTLLGTATQGERDENDDTVVQRIINAVIAVEPTGASAAVLASAAQLASALTGDELGQVQTWVNQFAPARWAELDASLRKLISGETLARFIGELSLAADGNTLVVATRLGAGFDHAGLIRYQSSMSPSREGDWSNATAVTAGPVEESFAVPIAAETVQIFFRFLVTTDE